jgi:hypothetical protein
MRINFSKDGSASVDISATDDHQMVVRLLETLRSDSQESVQKPVPALHLAPRYSAPEARRGRVERRSRLHSLNKKQYEMWSFLVDNDCESGVHRTAAAEYFGIGDDGAGQRLGRLVRVGLACRVGQGFYRAVDPSSEVSA